MTVSAETEAEIIRLFYVEHWKAGTIVAQLGVHEDVVKRVLGLSVSQSDAPREETPSLLVTPYRDFIDETLKRYPRLCATRIHDMIKERGYLGSCRTLRRFVATVRPAPKHEAFLRLDPLIGEQAQIDWAHVGRVVVPGGRSRPLLLFVMVLAWSRATWGEFCFDLSVHSLLRSLVRASTYFGGCARQWLFDNPKIVVLERHGDAVRFHPLLLDIGSMDFIGQGENILFRGPSGVGKTTLAQNLGHAALLRGYSVRFTSLAALLTDLLRRESLPALERCMRGRYLSPALLIVDELGFLPCDSRSADLLYNIINRRHESKSVVITTNLPFKQWGTVFPGAACVAALIDRFVQHCHVIDIDADSWRQKSRSPSPKKTK